MFSTNPRRINIILSGKWLRAAGFDTGQQVTVKVIKECTVLVAFNEQEQRLQDDYKRTKAKLIKIEDALLRVQESASQNQIQATWLSGCFWHTTSQAR